MRKTYKLKYRASNDPSYIRIHVAFETPNSNEFVVVLEEIGFVCCYDDNVDEFYSKIPVVIMHGCQESLRMMDDIKRLLKKYDKNGTIVLVEIVYSYKEIAKIYPELFKMVKPHRLNVYINQRNSNGILHIEQPWSDTSGLSRKFYLNGYGFQYYTNTRCTRIIIENENQLRKFKLIGMLDCLLESNKFLIVMFTSPILKHLSWEL